MAERQRGWPVWAIAALALAAIGGGLTLTGGPLQGRIERRDETRHNDLSALARQADCLSSAEGRADGDLRPTLLCPEEPRLSDPYSGMPYRIEALDSRHLRLCADFELETEMLRRRWGWPTGQWKGNCVVIQLSQPEKPG